MLFLYMLVIYNMKLNVLKFKTIEFFYTIPRNIKIDDFCSKKKKKLTEYIQIICFILL